MASVGTLRTFGAPAPLTLGVRRHTKILIMTSIFLSHSSSDKEFVRKLSRDIVRHGGVAWVDEAEMNVGDSLIHKIGTGIEDMEYLGVILSPASVRSEWVQREVEKHLTTR